MIKLVPRSFFNKMLIISCLIGVFPILLLGYLSFHKSASVLQEELTASNKLILQQNKARVESVLKTVDTLTTQTIITPVTTNAISMQSVLDLPFDYENREVFEKLIISLVQIQVFELGITDIKLVSYNEDWLVDSGAVYKMKNRVRVDKHDDLLSEIYHELTLASATGKSSYWKLDFEENGKSIIQLNKNIPLNSNHPYGLISVHIPLTELNKQLSGDSSSDNTFVVDSNGQVVSSLIQSDVGSLVTEQAYFKEIQLIDQLEGYFIDTIDNKELLIQFNKAQYNDWIYISVTPIKELMNKSKNIKFYTIISVSILILLVIATSYFFSNHMSSPIRRLYRSITKHQGEPDHNEIHFISDHLSELTTSKHQLKVQMNQLYKQAQEFFVIKLLLGHVNTSTIDEQLEKLYLPVNWETWSIVSLQIDRQELQYSAQDYDLMLFAICNIIDETIDKAYTLPPVINNQMIHLIMGSPLESPVSLKIYSYNAMVQLQYNIKSFLKLAVNIGISREHHDWIYTSLAYDESIHALYYRARLEDESILSIEEVEPHNSELFRYPKELENQLIESIKLLDEEHAEAKLEELLKHICSFANHHSDYQHAMNRLFNNLTGIIQDAGESISMVLEQHRLPLYMLESSHLVDETKQWLIVHLVKPLIVWNRKKIQKSEINISQFVTLEIMERYDQDLSIEYFASQLNYHPSYISRVFKKDVGVSFSDYLSNYRIEKAKYMLRHTNMKIADIAEKLRYSTASNFNRQFKKVVQLTPSRYREQED
ncbi:helix-turn-helix domain-containing protein [Paenibacillus nasutitermitis]|uniref:HTH-type transcriptional regulator YtdP n=1 Tax=Paenibacillus nasutitermitis TaxID=1652958 RepID=A0A916YNC9_9BACL|nr:helix-turn-helix domain-containing protein [Paenibacillus nasutitermitis]GGD52238.1 putative HTH-type transcriptional regulator YtdP [Paenibacillus nasutitermitis]